MKNEVVDAAYELQKTYPGISVQSVIQVVQFDAQYALLKHMEHSLTEIASSLICIGDSIGGPACGPSIPPEIEGPAKAAKAKR